MRERPSFRLTEVSSMGKVIPGSYNLVATDAAIEGRVLGNVYKDPTAIRTRMVWAAVVRGEGGESIYIGHHGTRQKAALAVAENWVVVQDEDEAHGIVEVMDGGTLLAVEHAQQQRADWGDASHLATELNAKHVLDESTEHLVARLDSLRKELSDVLNGKGSWKLELAHIERLAYDTNMIDLELERRERQARLQKSTSKAELMRESDEPVFCAECRLHINLHPNLANPDSENADEECCGRYQHQLTLMPSMPVGYNSWGTWRAVYFREQTRSERSKKVLNSVMARQLGEDLLKPTDGALVRSLYEHLTSPWSLTPGVMHELLNAVRELETEALESKRREPVSMVVEIQEDVLKRLVKLEGDHKVLKARTTMLLAGVVTALDEDEKTMLNLLKRTFAMTADDISGEV
jgi:hypothetical protein